MGANHQDTLKKLWTKLKSDANIFKTKFEEDVHGTGGGEAKTKKKQY